ncbi:acyl-CoA thioesterase [Aeromicrobium wangtongii]|uniref:Thioesterase family protein n=1 Tax=Aeromicrobium wangtongii TaxID=2969247 RepID=A0ABY5M8D5_9ACTN|nr:acyl-CoA thioesterase domain-containing protein [Aeromicrobium wangtongii]MCD9198714.1 thioesterase family protein [Aeromicrobium wangtongii]MCL3819626.1 thioesterase family protein [Aeromicrobium wangtongii]UUP13240.1 thioesterase family protein [Aeromicrobium wangtongii]
MFPGVWRGLDGIYGGYVLARVVEAVRVVDGFEPMSVSIQFTGAVRDVDSDWRVEVLHHGGSTAAVGVELVQGHPRLTAFGKLGGAQGERLLDFPIDLSDLPAPESLESYRFASAMPYESFLDHRLIDDPAHVRRGTTRAWIRFDESVQQAPELGRYGLAAIFLDAQPPGLFFTDPPPVYVPTVDFTIHFAPGGEFDRHGWHYVTQSTMWATAEFCVEESRLYDRSGSFIAQVRQTRRIVWSR